MVGRRQQPQLAAAVLSRRNAEFTDADWKLVFSVLRQPWSPDQISGRFRLEGGLRISHETIYRYI
jgi:transposase, IS30 family